MGTPQQTGAKLLFEHDFRLEALEIDPLAGLVSGPGGRESLDPKVMAVFMLMSRHTEQIPICRLTLRPRQR